MTIRFDGTALDARGERESAWVNAWTDTSQFLECDDAVRRPVSSHGNGDYGTSLEPTGGNTGNTNDTEDKTRVEIPCRYD